MKSKSKLLSLLLVFALIVGGLAACGQPSKKADKAAKTEKTEKNEVSEAAKTKESASEEAAEDKDGKKLNVMASTYVMRFFTEQIAGDKADVTQLMPPNAPPHGWEPSVQDMVKLENSDLIVINGAGMEEWLDKLMDAIPESGKKLVDSSAGLELLEGHAHDHGDHEHGEEAHDHEHGHDHAHDHEHGHDHAHDHGGNDPHTWLSPRIAKAQAKAIFEALSEKAPEHKEEFEKNYKALADRLDQLDAKFKEGLKDISYNLIVTNHEAFAYLCKEYGLEQIGITGVYADQEPSPARLAEIIELVEEKSVKTIFTEELLSPKVAETISEGSGAATAVLSPIGNLSQEQIDAGEDYFTIMEKNLEVLVEALK